MFCARRRLSALLLTAVLTLAGLVALSPTPAHAETSYHKLKKQLRKVERTAGEVGEAAADVAVEATLGICFGSDDDCDFSAAVPSKGGKAAAQPATHASPSRPVSNARPPEPKHEQRK
jgi:hypothetical protein